MKRVADDASEHGSNDDTGETSASQQSSLHARKTSQANAPNNSGDGNRLGWAQELKDWAIRIMQQPPSELKGKKKRGEVKVSAFAQMLAPGTLGLKWQSLGASKPTRGRKLVHADLAKALTIKTQFTQEEWDSFDMFWDLRSDDFIKSASEDKDEYFKPYESWIGVALKPLHHCLSPASSTLKEPNTGLKSLTMQMCPWLLAMCSITFLIMTVALAPRQDPVYETPSASTVLATSCLEVHRAQKAMSDTCLFVIGGANSATFRGDERTVLSHNGRHFISFVAFPHRRRTWHVAPQKHSECRWFACILSHQNSDGDTAG